MRNQEMKVSVIVTCYNKGKYIEECLYSIFNQSYRNIELIIFNDGSTDDSDEIIRECLKESPFKNTQYISTFNRGVITTRNDGIDKSNGESILFVDGDDYLDLDFINIMVDEMIFSDKDIVGCAAWDFIGKKYQNIYKKEFDIRDMLSNNIINASSLVKKKVIGEIRFDERLSNGVMEDYDFWVNLILNHNASVFYTHKTRLNYRILSDGRSRSNNRRKKYYFYKIFMKKYSNKISNKDFIFILKKLNIKKKIIFLVFRIIY